MGLLPPFELKQLALGAVHRVVRPHPDLRPWVACFWSMSARADSDEIVLISDACVDFIFSRQEPGGGFLSVSPLEAQSIALGQHTYFGIRFLPGVLPVFPRGNWLLCLFRPLTLNFQKQRSFNQPLQKVITRPMSSRGCRHGCVCFLLRAALS